MVLVLGFRFLNMQNNLNDQITEYDSNDRNASLKLIDWFDIKTIKKAKVLVVGAGAIGNEVLKNLALLGIGNIFIFDRDKIEISNLSRSILFRASDKDEFKAEVAARAVKNINPDTKPRWLNGDIRFDLGLGFINRMDVVIAGFDNVEARQVINRKCWEANCPWIEAGINVFDGQVAVYYPQKSACYDCNRNSQNAAKNPTSEYRVIKEGIDRSNSCEPIQKRYVEEGKVPTTPTMASIVAGVQVQEALKIISYKNWKTRNLINKKFTFDGTNGETMIHELAEYKACDIHQSTIKAKEVIKIPEVSTKTTVKEFVSIIRDKFGKNSTISLDFDLVVEMKCECGKIKPVLQPLDKNFREDFECEECGWSPEFWDPSVFRITTKLANFGNYEFGERFLNSTLAEISVPAFEWIEIYSTTQKRNFIIEISGDEKVNYGFNAIRN